MIRAIPKTELEDEGLTGYSPHPLRDEYTEHEWRYIALYIHESDEQNPVPIHEDIRYSSHIFEKVSELRYHSARVIGALYGMPTKSELLAHLNRLVDLNGVPPSETDIFEDGRYHPLEYFLYFDTLFDAVKEARSTGIEEATLRDSRHTTNQYRLVYTLGKKMEYTKEELLEAICDVGDDLGRPPKMDEVVERKNPSSSVYQRVFDGWYDALRQAGYEPVAGINTPTTDISPENYPDISPS